MTREQVHPALRRIFGNILGATPADLDPRRPFVEMGLDSLAFLQASQAIQQTFAVKVPFRRLLEELTTLELLEAYVADQLPIPAVASEAPALTAPERQREPSMERAESAREAIVSSSPAAVASGNGRAPGATRAAGAPPASIERIVAQQLEILSQQLALLRGESTAKRPATPQPPAAAAPATAAEPVQNDASRRTFVAYAPVQPRAGEELTPVQQAHVRELIARTQRRMPAVLQTAEEARPAVASSRATAGFRMLWKQIQAPLTASRAEGAHIWDVDGNEYVDLTMGFGALLFGHSPAFVVDTLHAQIDRGLQLGAESPATANAVRHLRELTGVERAAFCNSGTEAVMSALRLARTATGRTRIALFEGAYHGTFDGVMVRPTRREDGRIAAAPLAPGVPPSMIQDVLLLRMNDPGAIAAIREHGSELAAVLVEPLPSRFPDLRPQEFLRQLRAVTSEVGAALIFDELVTGFRIHPGGAQRLFGIEADLVTYGKAMGAGLPIAAVAGKAGYMDAIDGGAWRYDDDSYPAAETTFFAGTYFSHPLTMPVVEAVLAQIVQQGGRLHDQLAGRATHLANTLNTYCTAHDLPTRVAQFGSLFRFEFHPGVKHSDLFYFHMLEQGIYICETRNCFLSTAHSEEDIERVVAAAVLSLRQLDESGFLPSRTSFRTGLRTGAPAAPSLPVERRLPLTDAQKDLWVVSQLGDDASRAYNESSAVHLRGPLDATALQQAVAGSIAAHDALRTTLLPDGSGQIVHRDMPVEITIVDLRTLDPAEKARRSTELLRADGAYVFDLATGPLVRASILRLADDEHILALTIHHIVIDGVSKGRLLHEISLAYAARRTGRPLPAPQVMSFEEYVRQKHDETQASVVADDGAYWTARLSGIPMLLNLPQDNFPAARSYAGARVQSRFGAGEVEKLRRASASRHSTPFLTLFAAWTLLLHRLTRQANVVVGAAIADQPIGDRRSLVGYCLALVPFRVDVDVDLSFSAFLDRVKVAWYEAYEHRHVSLADLIRTLNPARDPDRSFPLSAAFNLDKTAPMAFDEAVTAEVVENFCGSSKFDVYLGVVESDRELVFDLEYNSDLFREATARRWVERLSRLVGRLLDQPDVRVGDLLSFAFDEPAASAGAAVATAAGTAPDARVDELVERQVHERPDAVAVVDGDRHLTYQVLNAQADALAAWLISQGIGPEDRVAIATGRALPHIVAILATVKAGAAYVPLDISAPDARLAYVLNDSGARLLLVTDATSNLAPTARCRRLNVDRDVPEADADSHRARTARRPRSMDEAAYVIYTSGSTGQAKGVIVTHRGLSNYLCWCMTAYPVHEGRGSLVASSVAFDLTVTGLWLPLIAGRAVWLLPESDPMGALTSVLERTADFSLIKLTPAHLELLSQTLPAHAAGGRTRSFVIGGEALRSESLDFWRTHAPDTRLFNEYGPTETVVGCCVYEVGAETDPGPVAIGVPIANTQLHVLDDRLEPCPAGVPGELYVGGDGVARGYLNKPDLTSKAFLPDPFDGRPGARMYRTGDLVRRRDDGQLEFLGRTDDQVKIHGFRIEPGEIEAALRAHRDVADAAVVLTKDPEVCLRAFVVPAPGATVDERALTEYLATTLPPYMLPRWIEPLATLPLTANGKVDRQALGRRRPAARALGPSDTPQGPAEERLASIVADVLKLETVSVNLSFFELGGDSIQAIRVSARAKRAGIAITPKQIFELRTVRALARATAESPAAAAAPQPVAGDMPLTPIQHWFFELRPDPPAHFNQAVVIELPSAVQPAPLKNAVAQVVAHHDALRLRFRTLATGHAQHCAGADQPAPFEVIDLAPGAGSAEFEQHATRLQGSLDLEHGPIMRAALVRQGARERLLLIVHHLAVDVVSWQILVDDLFRTYTEIERGEPVRLPARTTSYQTWSRRLRELAGRHDVVREAGYWERELAGADGSVPADGPGPNLEGDAETLTVELEQADTSRLVADMPQQHGASVADAVLTVVGRGLRRWADRASIVVDVEGHGREEGEAGGLDLTRTIGWFTAIYPVALEGRDGEGEIEELRRIHEQLRRVPRSGLGYGILKYLSTDAAVRRRIRALPAAQVSVNYIGRVDGAASGAWLESSSLLGPMKAPRTPRPYLIDVLALVADGRLRLSWTFSANCHERRTIAALAEQCLDELRGMARQCAPDDEALDLQSLEQFLGNAHV